jgi:hypothetical protein
MNLFLIELVNCNFPTFEIPATALILFWITLFGYNVHKN